MVNPNLESFFKQFIHTPVLLKEVIQYIQPRSGGIYLDCTVGLGGHASAILENSSPDGRLIGIDLDKDAIAIAQKNLSRFQNRVILIHGNFANLDKILEELDISSADGILMDLGVSSLQLETPHRGFSFLKSGPLDMRMDGNCPYSAQTFPLTTTPLPPFGKGERGRGVVRKSLGEAIHKTNSHFDKANHKPTYPENPSRSLPSNEVKGLRAGCVNGKASVSEANHKPIEIPPTPSVPPFPKGAGGIGKGGDRALVNEVNIMTAAQELNTRSKEELTEIFYKFGEERWSSRIASEIVKVRVKQPLTNTLQLVDIIERVVPKKSRGYKIHPATRVFQALRIHVNQELHNLELGLKHAVKALKPGAVICIISFHSLEDRIIKQTFRFLSRKCICPPKAPICTCNHKPSLKLLTPKPIIPQSGEIQQNPRARSAKLRVAMALS